MSVARPAFDASWDPAPVRPAPSAPAAAGASWRGRVPAGRGALLAAVALVAFPFYFAGQDWETSRAAAFTQTADEMEAAANGGNGLRQVAFLTLGGCGLWCLTRDRRRRRRAAPGWWSARLPGGRTAGLLAEWIGVARRAHPVAWLLAAYLAWCFASLLWSHAPGQTFRKLVVLGCWIAGSLGVARALSPRRIVWVGVLVPAAYLALGVLAELSLGTFRPWGGEYRFAGTMHPNTQGLTLASLLAGALVLWRSRRRQLAATRGERPRVPARNWLLALAGAAALFTLLTKSRTSAAGLLLCVGGLAVLSAPPRWRLAAAVGGGTVGAGALGLALSVGADPLGGALDAATLGRGEQLSSLTGRTEIWAEVGRFTARRPLAGWGYDSFWTPGHVAEVSENVGWGLREAHGAYRDVRLSVGRIGLWLLVPGLLWAWCLAARRYARGERRADRGDGFGDPLAGYVAALLAVGLLNACTESAMVMVVFTPFLICCGLAKLFVFPRETVSPFRPASGGPSAATGADHGPRGPSNPDFTRPARSAG